ncbi:MAG: N-6 DNA methylase [Candidatus Zixiibacteriota bacterium]|nr:MAG: N-6 DNA methylase [candidate division Zixibacteria bacterium]
MIEFKGPNVNLDKDRFSGRTAIQQCWDYLNDKPDCKWGIVSNYISIRLYNRNKTPKVYQLFVLQELRKKDKFREFYYLLSKGGLFPGRKERRARADILLEKTGEQQLKVGADLYEHYRHNRLRLIDHLTKKPHGKHLEKAIRIAQKIIDRIIFVAFCEDRGLLPEKSIHEAFSNLPPFTRVTNPKWRNFLELFQSINEGNEKRRIPPYNGGLFRPDEEVDNLELDDSWTNFFDVVSKYDFRHEVNEDVLGHLFEKSVNDIEEIQAKGTSLLFPEDKKTPRMLKSAKRKWTGIFYTPVEFTDFITKNVVGKLIDDRFSERAKSFKLSKKDLVSSNPDPKLTKYWRACLEELRKIKIIDPACGSGAFLIKAFDILEAWYQEIISNIYFHEGKEDRDLLDQIPDFILHDNLYGIDLSQEAVEITQLALWIRSAEEGKSLEDLSENIIFGNSLIQDEDIDPTAIKWQEKFPEIFNRKENGFDCVIGNPPWERLNIKNREFFADSAPHVLTATNAAESRKLIEDLAITNPELYALYKKAKDNAEKTIDYVRDSSLYPLTAKGDINTYSVFAELSMNIIANNGIVGLLVPSGIVTDHSTRDFFARLLDSKIIAKFYDFENRKRKFPDIDGRFKFSILVFGGSKRSFKTCDFVFFAHEMQDLYKSDRHISLTADDIKLLNPNTHTCPIFRSKTDAELTRDIYKRIPILIDENRHEGGNPWGINYMLMFHQSFDADKFENAKELSKRDYKLRRNIWSKGKKRYLPLFEAKMIKAYDHRAASVKFDRVNWTRQGQTIPTSMMEHKNPEFLPMPRWWIDEPEVNSVLKGYDKEKIIAYKNVTSPTNQRTMISAFVPVYGYVHSAPLIFTDSKLSVRRVASLLANLNSFVFDYICRQKIGGINLSYYILNQIPTLPPAFYTDRCPWNRRQTLEKWVSERVLKLSCTSNDMIPLAEAAGFEPTVWSWKPDERKILMAELDAAYFIMYSISREDVEYILSTFSGIQKEKDGFFEAASTYDLILKYYDLFKEKMKS